MNNTNRGSFEPPKAEVVTEKEKEMLESRAFEVKSLKICAIVFVCIVVLGTIGHLLRHPIFYLAGSINMLGGNYSNAIDIYESLGEYADSSYQVSRAKYLHGCELLEEGKYDEASAVFSQILSFEGVKEKYVECHYHLGLQYYEAGDYHSALTAFTISGGYADSDEYISDISTALFGDDSDAGSALDKLEMAQAREDILKQHIAVGFYHTVGLKKDGTVVATGSNEFGQCDVSGWSDVVAIDAGAYFTIGLTSNGKVLFAGSGEYGENAASGWSDIVGICAGDYDVIGVKSDGTIVTCGWHDYSSTMVWNDIKSVGAGSYHLVGINSRGQAFSANPSAVNEQYRDLYKVAVGSTYTIGLKNDGSLVTSSKMNLSGWTRIVDIAAGSNGFVALLEDGTVKGYYFTEHVSVDLSKWEDVIAITAGGTHYAAICSDGSVVAKGMNNYGQCDVEDWDLF